MATIEERVIASLKDSPKTIKDLSLVLGEPENIMAGAVSRLRGKKRLKRKLIAGEDGKKRLGVYSLAKGKGIPKPPTKNPQTETTTSNFDPSTPGSELVEAASTLIAKVQMQDDALRQIIKLCQEALDD